MKRLRSQASYIENELLLEDPGRLDSHETLPYWINFWIHLPNGLPLQRPASSRPFENLSITAPLKKAKHQSCYGSFDLSLFDTLKHDMKKCTKEAYPQQDSTSDVVFASMALPQKREDLCTLFWLSLLTPPASPLMRKMVLEYHFDHFILLLSAALIHASVQSVGPNPLMNVFFWGFTWQHIPTPGQWTSGWLLQRVFYFILQCQMFMFEKHHNFFFFAHIKDDMSLNWNEWRHKRKPDRCSEREKINQWPDRHQFSKSLNFWS